MTFSSFKSEKYEWGMNDGCWSWSNNTQLFNSKFKSIEKENANSQERFASLLKGNYESFTNDDKRKINELEIQSAYLLQENK